jgi:hypothetical protein
MELQEFSTRFTQALAEDDSFDAWREACGPFTGWVRITAAVLFRL